MKVQRYWHTLRHLRPVQVYGRLWLRLHRPRADLRPAPPLRAKAGPWVAPVLRAPSMQGRARFRFLNETHGVVGPDAWNDPAREKLWLYNLHYFDDLNAANAEARPAWHLALMQRWVRENPPGHGNGWEPYPVSLRTVNWMKWSLRGNALATECRQSLAVQVRWLRVRLEHHLLGNHLFANAKALVFAGAFFAGPEAWRWLRLGQRLLVRELREQILPDGGHFERSPMYHAILLEDLLDVTNLAQAYPGTLDKALVTLCQEKALAMLDWLEAMCHPDGEIGFFNDAAFGIAPTLEALVRYRERLVGPTGGTLEPNAKQGGLVTHSYASGDGDTEGSHMSPVWLRSSGYVRLQAGPAVVLVDVAPIGPEYLPGHAHADTLSFELSLFGQRVIVNGGTSRYGSGPKRLAERGTAAHNTVQVDGVDSSEVWGGFRVARRARPFDVRVLSGDPCRVSAAHDGYRRLPGRVVHRRSWELTADQLKVVDRVEGGYQEAIARFHLHPDITAEWTDQIGQLRLSGGQMVRVHAHGGLARLVPDLWHPQFGLEQPSHCLELRIHGGVCALHLTWTAE